MQIKKVENADVAGKRVLLSVDYNVPIEAGKVADDSRIRATLPTISLLRDRGAAKIILATHLGRPEGKVVEGLRTAPLFEHLKTLMSTTDMEILENLRFNPGEEANDPAFAKELAAQADVYVDDAFANCHRAHASIVGVAKLLPAYAGLLLEKEITELSKALAPQKPALAIIGGAKFETKEPLLSKLLETYDHILLGGALANDLLKARGVDVKRSLTSSAPPSAMVADARILAPVDYVWQDEKIVDIGPETAKQWAAMLASAHFVLWNGPLGIYEHGQTAGTDAVAQALAISSAAAVIGGGDTEEAIAKTNFDASRVFISTGGGAMLEFLTQGTLPGIEVLKS